MSRFSHLANVNRIPPARRCVRSVIAFAAMVIAGSSLISLAKDEGRVDESHEQTTRVRGGDWTQFGGSSLRNNAPEAENIPADIKVVMHHRGKFTKEPVPIIDRLTRKTMIHPETGEEMFEQSRNIKWAVPLGSQTYGTPVVAGGKVFVGTNNGHGYLPDTPADVDASCLLCFREEDGAFLWQYTSHKLETGRVNDWPMQGLTASPLVQGDRLWLVTNRCEVVCLDTEGLLDGRNEGPYRDEKFAPSSEADVIWKYDMMGELDVFPHNMTHSCVTCWGDLLFVVTSNGVDESHLELPSPDAPSFIALNKHSGELVWQDNSPGEFVLHAQWSSPACGVFDGVPQVIFAGGDGWVYSFSATDGKDGKPLLLWKFDANPKWSQWGMRGNRNDLIVAPVIYGGRIYVATGQDPEHGEGQGRLMCIDPTKRGDVSAEQVFDKHGKPAPRRRHQAAIADDEVRKNPNSALVWEYRMFDLNGDGRVEPQETMHRTLSAPAIKDDLLVVPDIAGIVHCLDARTGKPYWTHDMLAAVWTSPLIADGKVFVCDEDGDLEAFILSADPRKAMKEIEYVRNSRKVKQLFPINAEKIVYFQGRRKRDPLTGKPIIVYEKREKITVPNLGTAIYTSPIVANDVLYIAAKNYLFAIAAEHDRGR